MMGAYVFSLYDTHEILNSFRTFMKYYTVNKHDVCSILLLVTCGDDDTF